MGVARGRLESVERPGVAPGFPVCETGVFLVRRSSQLSIGVGGPAANRTLSFGFGIRLVSMTSCPKCLAPRVSSGNGHLVPSIDG